MTQIKPTIDPQILFKPPTRKLLASDLTYPFLTILSHKGKT